MPEEYTAVDGAVDTGKMAFGAGMTAVSAKQATKSFSRQSLKAAARVGERVLAKTGVKALASGAKLTKAAAGPVGIATAIVSLGALASDAEHNMAYALQGKDFQEEKEKLMMDDSVGRNVVSEGIDAAVGGMNDLGDGINEYVGKPLEEMWDSMPKGTYYTQYVEMWDPETNSMTYEPVEMYAPGFGEVMNGIGFGLEWAGDNLVIGTVEDLQTLSNNAGMDYFGAAPVELDSNLKADEEARERVMEMLSDEEFAEEGLAERLAEVYDRDRGVVVGGWEEVEAMLEEQKASNEAIAEMSDEELLEAIMEENPDLDEEAAKAEASAARSMSEAVPQVTAASLGVSDPEQYLDGMTPEKADQMLYAADAFGLLSYDEAGDEEALVPHDVVEQLSEGLADGSISQVEAGAFMACQLDRLGALDENGDIRSEYAEQIALDDYAAAQQQQQGQAAADAGAHGWASEEDAAAFLAEAEAEGLVDAGFCEDVAAAVEAGETTYSEVGDIIAGELGIDPSDPYGEAGAAPQGDVGYYAWSSDEEAIEFLQYAEDLGLLEPGFTEAIAQMVSSGEATWTEAGDVVLEQLDAMNAQNQAAAAADVSYEWTSDAEVVDFLQEAESAGIVEQGFTQQAAEAVASGEMTYDEIGDAVLGYTAEIAEQNAAAQLAAEGADVPEEGAEIGTSFWGTETQDGQELER